MAASLKNQRLLGQPSRFLGFLGELKLKLKFWLLKPKFLTLILAVLSLIFVYKKHYDLIRSEPVNSWNTNIHGDCAIVLTGGPGRVKEGFDLLARGSVRKLIISGVYPGASLREIFPNWPFYGNLNEDDVFLERRSGTTYGNAQQTLPIIEALHCRDVVLITSSDHMPRAFLTFKNTFPANVNLIKDSVASGRWARGFWDSTDEVFKSIFYSIWAY